MALASFDRSWEGPLAEITGLPEMMLVGLVITFFHAAGCKVEETLAKALRPLAGGAKPVHYALLRRRLEWHKHNWPLAARTGKRRVVVQAECLKARQVRELVAALGTVDGARDLRIRGRYRQDP